MEERPKFLAEIERFRGVAVGAGFLAGCGRISVFQGTSELALDGKGRLSIPARQRETLLAQCEGRVTLTLHHHGCLLIYPRPVWEQKRDELARDYTDEDRIELARLITGSAYDTELDSAGRVLIPSHLRTDACLQRDVLLLGLGSYLELWDPLARQERRRTWFANGQLPPPARNFNYGSREPSRG